MRCTSTRQDYTFVRLSCGSDVSFSLPLGDGAGEGASAWSVFSKLGKEADSEEELDWLAAASGDGELLMVWAVEDDSVFSGTPVK
jgi:hypothetical protein